MQNDSRTFFFAKSVSELFYQLKSVSGLKVIGGATRLEEIPEKAISIRGIQELSAITKHERYLDCGPAVTLGTLLAIPSAHIPAALPEAARSVANPMVRNLATIGGAVAATGVKSTLYAPLLALDARIEFKSQNAAPYYIPLQAFAEIPEKSIISNIRIPLNDWDIAIFRRLGPNGRLCESSASFVFLANTERRVVNNIKIAFAGALSFRCLELENRLISARLPIDEKDIARCIEMAALQFDAAAQGQEIFPLLKTQFVNLVRHSLEQLS